MEKFLILGAIVFSIGLGGMLLNQRHLIVILVGIELMLLGVNITFVTISRFTKAWEGQIFSLFVLAVAAAEAAVGLALLLALFRVKGTVTAEALETLQKEEDE